MFTITNDEHIADLLKNDLPISFKQHLTTEYEALKASLHHDDQQPFTLEEHGYRMIVLQANDDCRCLPIDSNHLNLLESFSEYVELIQLPTEVCIYRACLMFDNECFVLVYALVGASEPVIEQWLSERTGEVIR